MSVVKDKEDEIREALSKLQKDIDNIEKRKEPSQREKLIKKIIDEIDNVQGLLESFEFDRLELEAVDSGAAAPFKSVQAQLEKKFNELKHQFEVKKNPELAAQHALDMANNPMITSSQLIAEGNRVQKAGLDSLQNTLNKITGANAIADDILLEQERQVEQLGKSMNYLKDTKSDIKNANAYIKYFARELVKDKIWRIILLLIVLALLGVVILKFTGGSYSFAEGSDNDTDLLEVDDY